MAAFSLSVSSAAYGQEERESFEVAGVDVQRGFREFHKSLVKELEANEKRMASSTSENSRVDQDMRTTKKGLPGGIRKFIEAFSVREGFDLVLRASAQSSNQTSLILGGKGGVDFTDKIIRSLNRDAPKGRKKIEP